MAVCESDCRGVAALDANRVNELFLLSYRNNVQVFAHCNGDAALDLTLAGHEYALNQLKETARQKDRRTVIVHSQIMRPEQLDAYAKYGILRSFFTNHTYFWGDVHLANPGEARASFISPMRSAIDKGIRAANHSDYFVTPIDQMFIVWSAVNRITRSGRVLGPEQRITPYEALQAITLNGAYMVFEENEKGSLVPGKLADLVLVDGALAQLGLEVSAATRQQLIDYVAGGEFGSESWYEMKLRGMYMLLLSLPEAQVH